MTQTPSARPAPAATTGPVLVVGAGLLGASIGLGLRHLGVDVWLQDASPTAEAVAQDIGAGRSCRAAGPAPEPALVVVATPPDVTARTVTEALERHPGAVVLDIASVKEAVLEGVRELGGDLTRYVGTHPMAGRERSGPVAARGELFTSMPWVVCDSGRSSPAALAAAKNLAVDLGATVTFMDAREHDATVALISHLPQVMSSLLASRLQDTPLHHLSLAGQGLRDTTRIAASDPHLWVQILSANAEPVVASLHGVRQDLDRLIATLEGPEAPGARLDIAQLIAEGNAGQARIPGKHGGAPRSFASLTVLVGDVPGQLARLLTEIGEIGVNLEDLRLEHSPGQPVGLAEVSVLPNRRKELVEALQERGWKVVQ
ncbi:prephenate dehydrogenase [Kocuria turfanensis]|uniref:Prephenate dehydrogenase n=1 Tax=Kocuria turfanensis TaxID=388357 RepID=A0A512IE89_9MICC|nr:prephenate dehydrogenase [Kocuria turfanensis]GEO96015.1 prephenate dehydrogenase [Kocuria turfanensis]